VSMFRRTIFTSVIYFWSIPRMLLDQIYRSVKELVRNSFLQMLFYVLNADREHELLSAWYYLLACVVTRPSLELSLSFTRKCVLFIAA
jgi:hypothetical protein